MCFTPATTTKQARECVSNRNSSSFPPRCKISSGTISPSMTTSALFSDKVRIQINDTHPALIIPELIRILTKKHDIPWKMAVDMAMTCTGYTNHTILSEALEQWEQPSDVPPAATPIQNHRKAQLRVLQLHQRPLPQ